MVFKSQTKFGTSCFIIFRSCLTQLNAFHSKAVTSLHGQARRLRGCSGAEAPVRKKTWVPSTHDNPGYMTCYVAHMGQQVSSKTQILMSAVI
jgi:hypothetical protein